MRLLAIANISNGISTIGYRLLDTDTRQIKDVPITNIISVLSYGNVQIDNLEVKDGMIIGSNGSIDRLPKIINGQLVEKSPLIIINEIENVGYTVSDYQGRVARVKTEDVVKYATLHGIANGKVVRKDGKEYVSSINGQYDKVKYGQPTTKTTGQGKQGKLYTGEEVESIKPLLPIRFSYQLIHYKNGKLLDEKVSTRMKVDIKGNIRKNRVYEFNGYTLVRAVDRKLSITDKSNLGDIIDLIRLEKFRKSIDKSIREFTVVDKNKEIRKDIETGLLIPDGSHEYFLGQIREHLESTKNDYENLDNSIINSYIKKLNVMKPYISADLEIGYNNLVLSRRCTSKGIDFKVLKISEAGISEISTMRLEDIYDKKEDYQNTEEINGEFLIRGLDGVYKYDMDKIYKAYNRYIAPSTRNLKAVLVDPKYHEAITTLNELKELRCGKETILIPSNVTTVLKDSIIITDDNLGIVFGNGIIKYHSNAIINNREYGHRTLLRVTIESDAAVGLNIIESLYNTESIRTGVTDIIYLRNITPEEYGDLIYRSHDNSSLIQAPNLASIEDQFILDTISSLIKRKLNNCEILNQPIEYKPKYLHTGKFEKLSVSPAYKQFKSEFKNFRSFWEGQIIGKKVSEHVASIIKETIDKIQDKLDVRQEELNENRKSTLETIERQL